MATKAELKAALDALEVSYPSRASKGDLQILLTDAQQAASAAEEELKYPVTGPSLPGGPAADMPTTRPPLKEPGEITRIFLEDDGEKHIAMICRKRREDIDSTEEATAESYRDMLTTLEAYLLEERRRVGG